jgi:hypothetical protein
MTPSGRSVVNFAVVHNAVFDPDDVIGLASRPEGQMRRRHFISLVGGAAAAWPLAARAQQAGKLPTIGYLGGATPSAMSQLLAAFVQRLRELGWIEGSAFIARSCRCRLGRAWRSDGYPPAANTNARSVSVRPGFQ